MVTNCNHTTFDSLIECGGSCAKLLAPPRYWVRAMGGYPNDPDAYMPANSKRECAEIGLVDFGYLDNPGAWVYVGNTAPWASDDPYPDWVIERGPRGGVRWEQA